MSTPKVPPYLCVVNPAEWAFRLVQRTRADLIACPPKPRHHQENLPVLLVYDDRDWFE